MRRSFSHSFMSAPPWTILFFSLLSLLSSVSALNATKKICQTKECLSAAQNLKESINFKANPCDDFYKYACGNWPKVHKNSNLYIPGSTIQLRDEENMAELYDFLKQNNSKEEPEAVHKARQLYSLCLNEAAYSNKLEPIEKMLKKIGLPVLAILSGEIKNYDYTTALARAAKFAGIKTYFDLTTGSNPYNQTVNMITLGKIAETPEYDPTILPLTIKRINSKSRQSGSKRATGKITEEEFMAEVMRRLCQQSAPASCAEWNSYTNAKRNKIIENILTRSSELTEITSKPAALNSSLLPVVYSLKQLQDLTDSIATEVKTQIPKLNWTRYIEETYADLDNIKLDLSDPTKVQIAIGSLDSIKEIIRFIHETKSVKKIELDLWWEVVSNLLPYSDLRIFDMKNKIDNLVDSPTREERCAEITRISFGMAISYGYATKEKYIKAKTRIRKMYEHIRDSYKKIIQEVPWMDETTRQRALKKLQSLKSYIVYPSAIKTTNKLNDFYQDVKISNNFYDTMITKIQNQVKKYLSKLNKINDLNEDDWILTPNIVNAFYHPERNTIVIPAGILGLSIYNHSLRALDYGGIGSIVGHELTHAFDNTGRRYNEIGNLEDWWQPETANAYREKAKCFVNAYSNYSIDFGGVTQMGDSKVTLGEDISDSGGFKESLLAYKNCVSEFGEEQILPQFENFTHEQLLTIAFANVWCENPTVLSPIIAQLDEHSPGGVRVNGVLQNSKEFAEIWKCPKGSKMNPNKEKCSIW
ncbi:neprilysin-like [Planococcus citri]|uniref:neprilysin-like n=1 Tax=Planococcus citri TaxID=170843 RepID=UPI0031F9008C